MTITFHDAVTASIGDTLTLEEATMLQMAMNPNRLRDTLRNIHRLRNQLAERKNITRVRPTKD